MSVFVTQFQNQHYFVDGATAAEAITGAEWIEGVIIGTPIASGTVTLLDGAVAFAVLTLSATPLGGPIYVSVKAQVTTPTITVVGAGSKTTVIYQTRR